MDRPTTRAECVSGPRPCPWVSCRYHLAIDVRGEQLVQLRRKRGAPSCALDVAELGGMPLDGVGELLGVTRERVRQIEKKAAAKLRKVLGSQAFGDMVPGDG